MSLTTYAELQTAIGVELNRTDLTGVIPDFITRAEARFRRDLRDWLRQVVTLTNVTGDTILAATVDAVLAVNYNDGTNGSHNFPLDLVSSERYHQLLDAQSIATSLPGQLCYVDYTEQHTITLRFWPPIGSSAPIANLSVECVGVLAGLSATQTSNALLVAAPDVYLYGALAESAAYLSHDERIPIWENRCLAGIRGLRAQQERRLYGGAPRPRQLARVFG